MLNLETGKESIMEVTTENKRYRGFWSSQAFYGQRYRTLKESDLPGFFCEEYGYKPEDLAAIQNLKVGEVWESQDYGMYHTVRRQK
jgi:hypothetical protein